MTAFSLSATALLDPVGAGLDLLASAVGKGPGEGDALFLLRAGPYLKGELTVLAFRGTERISELFDFTIDIVTSVDPLLFEAAVLGMPASFVWHVPGCAPRVVQGVIGSVREQSVDLDHNERRWRVRLVPAAWVLTKRVRSRIFQDKTIADIVTSVLQEVGVAAQFTLVTPAEPHAYCVQYQESDWAFVTRLLAEAGLFFHFEPPAGALDALTGGMASTLGGAATAVSGMLGGEAGKEISDIAQTALLAETMVVLDRPELSPAIPDEGEGVLGLKAEAMGAAGGFAAGKAASALGGSLGATVGGVIGHAVSPTPKLLYREDAVTTEDVEVVTRFSLTRRVTSNRVELRDYLYEAPLAELRGRAGRGLTSAGGAAALAGSLAGAAAGSLAGNLGGSLTGGFHGSLTAGLNPLAMAKGALLGAATDLTPHEVYDHHGDFHEPAANDATARRWLEQVGRKAREAQGHSRCRRLSPGYLFTLTEHPDERYDGEYLLTEVRHRGVSPVWAARTQPGQAVRVYENRFVCVTSSIAPRPARPVRTLRQTLETARVVGPAGQEIYTDSAGRIKVQFHWDREGKGDEKSSCWLRVMQAWSGPGFGAQFVPRVGMEVVVSFLGGDPDRPVVMGCVPNAWTPMPFRPSEEATRSGWKTRSSPGGGGYNELSFDDAAGLEEVRVHAERDLNEVVRRDHNETVYRDTRRSVRHDAFDTIGHDSTETIANDAISVIGGDRRVTVGGNALLIGQGDADVHISGAAQTRVEGRARHAVAGATDMTLEDDATLRVRGSYVMQIGHHDANRAYVVNVEGMSSLTTSKRNELISDEEIVFRCGESSIRLTKKGIEICGPSVITRSGGTSMGITDKGTSVKAAGGASVTIGDGKVGLQSAGASMHLDSDATLTGSSIKMTPPSSAGGGAETKKDEMTLLEVVDPEGAPLAGTRYRVRFDEGAELAGVVDEKGGAVLQLEQDAEVLLIDVLEGEPGGGAAVRPHVVRQGEYVAQLALRYGFDADAIWNDPKNEDLRTLRNNPNVLAPGDILYLPETAPRWHPVRKGQLNRLVATVPKATITLRLGRPKAPLAGEGYQLEGGALPAEGTTDANGALTCTVPLTTRALRILVPSQQKAFTVLLGHLDPPEIQSGMTARLIQMGYLLPPAHVIMGLTAEEVGKVSDEPDDAHVRKAVRVFQRDKSLPETGEIDTATANALKVAFGA